MSDRENATTALIASLWCMAYLVGVKLDHIAGPDMVTVYRLDCQVIAQCETLPRWSYGAVPAAQKVVYIDATGIAGSIKDCAVVSPSDWMCREDGTLYLMQDGTYSTWPTSAKSRTVSKWEWWWRRTLEKI